MSMPFAQPSATLGAPVGLDASQPIDDRQMSRLPVGGQWPPAESEPITFMFRVWDSWWVGDRQKLAWTYYNLGANSPYGRAFFATTGEKGMPTPRPGQFRGGLLGSIEYSFWLPEASPCRQGRRGTGPTSR